MNEKQRELLSNNVGYIIKRVKSYDFTPPLNYECCINYVLKKMTERMSRFDDTKSSIYTFIYNNVRFLVLDYYKEHKTAPCLKEVDEVDNRTPESDYWKEREEYEIASAINELRCKDRNVLLLYYYENRSKAYIGRLFGVSRQAISQQVDKVLKILKPKIERRLKELDDIRSEL